MTDSWISLDVIDVASPCSVPWDTMKGDDRVRYCGQCNLNVYNLSELSRPDAEAIVNSREGRLCIRFFRRQDGTILTQDCPVGLRAVRRKLAQLVTTIAAMIVFLVTSMATFALGRPRSLSQSGPLKRLANFCEPQWAFAGAMVLTAPTPQIFQGSESDNTESGNSEE